MKINAQKSKDYRKANISHVLCEKAHWKGSKILQQTTAASCNCQSLTTTMQQPVVRN